MAKHHPINDWWKFNITPGLPGVPATLASGSYRISGQHGNTDVFGAGLSHLTDKGNGLYTVSHPGVGDKDYHIRELDGGQFALLDYNDVNGPYLVADYNAGGVVSAKPEPFSNWSMFNITPSP